MMTVCVMFITIENSVECLWVLSFDGDFVCDVDRVCLEIVELLIQCEGVRHPFFFGRERRKEPLGSVSRGCRV
jgi:hypothetical protein